MPKPRSFDGFPVDLRCEYGPFMAVVEANHDGDTILVSADAGFSHFPPVWIRLSGVMAAELWEPFGDALAVYAASVAPPGTPCKLRTEKMPRTGGQKMTLSRYAGVVELPDGRTLNDLVNAEIERLQGQARVNFTA